MRYYFAPMEGLTDSIYRRVHHEFFGGVDRYFMPFLSPTVHRALTPREAREAPPANSVGFVAVPQLLTKVPEDFTWMAGQCKELGYDEVNLNLGCPSGTVTAKGKGSGMLRDLKALDEFLDAIFYKAPLPISVKTRIGFSSNEELPALLDIYNKYPIKELTVHPRIREAFYKGPVDLEAFRYCVQHSRAPLCYNGDIQCIDDIAKIQQEYGVEAVMIGRGLIADPGMLLSGGTDKQTLLDFTDRLMEEYTAVFGSVRNAMFRMKENWGMIASRFEGSEKLKKRLQKTTDPAEFRTITRELVHTLSKISAAP